MARLKRYSDIDLNFTRHPNTNDVVRKWDTAAVVQSVKTLLLSHFYERPFHPEIGSQIKAALFENFSNDTKEMLKTFIINVLTNFEPRATLIDLEITEDGRNSIDLAIALEVVNTQEIVTFSFILERLR